MYDHPTLIDLGSGEPTVRLEPLPPQAEPLPPAQALDPQVQSLGDWIGSPVKINLTPSRNLTHDGDDLLG